MAKSAKNNPKQKSASDVAVNVKGNVNTQNSGDNKKIFLTLLDLCVKCVRK